MDFELTERAALPYENLVRSTHGSYVNSIQFVLVMGMRWGPERYMHMGEIVLF